MIVPPALGPGVVWSVEGFVSRQDRGGWKGGGAGFERQWRGSLNGVGVFVVWLETAWPRRMAAILYNLARLPFFAQL